MMRASLLIWSLASMALAADPGPAKAFKPAPAVEKLCDNSSEAEIIGSYNRIWGAISEQRGIGMKESAAIEDALVDFHACRAIAAKSDVPCQALAKIPYRGAQYEFLDGRCKLERARLAFDDLLTGRSSASQGCQDYFHDTGLGEAIGAPATEICGAIQSRGGRSVCAAVSSRGWKYADCRKDLPGAAKDCAGDAECLARLRLSDALRDRNAAGCPPFLAHACRIWLEDSPAECLKAELTLRRTYCKLYARADKRTRGQVGYDDEQIKQIGKLNELIRARQKSKE